jgi:hypothetical protein
MRGAMERGEFKGEQPNENDDEVSAKKKLDEFYEFWWRRCAPQPDTYEWYQLFGACHWLVPWLLKLGRLIFPDLKWMAVRGELHSFAGGLEGTKPRMLFDILFFKKLSAQEIIGWFHGKPPSFPEEDPCSITVPDVVPSGPLLSFSA